MRAWLVGFLGQGVWGMGCNSPQNIGFQAQKYVTLV